MTVYRHICEVCDRREDLTEEAAFQAGWDYPPRMGAFGVLSARTCPSCPITGTLWWRLTTGEVDGASLTEKDIVLVQRIQTEPASIMLTN